MNFFSHSFNFYCSKLFWWPWKSISIVVLSLISINPVFTENSCTLRKHTTTFRKTNDCTSKQRSSCCKANQLLQPVAYGQNVSACAAQTCSVISYGAYIWNKTYICTDFSFLFFFFTNSSENLFQSHGTIPWRCHYRHKLSARAHKKWLVSASVNFPFWYFILLLPHFKTEYKDHEMVFRQSSRSFNKCSNAIHRCDDQDLLKAAVCNYCI